MSLLRLRHDDLFWHDLDNEIVALDANRSRYFRANRTAAALWRRLRDGATESDLADTLCERYGVARDVAEADVRAFVQHLAARGLLAD